MGWERPRIVAAHQVRNWADIQGFTGFLENYREVHGRYPSQLSDAVPDDSANRRFWLKCQDVYGHPLNYESNGDRFLLASYGRDGARDDRGYGQRGAHGDPDDSPCYDEDVDTAYSSDGVFQACGK